MITFIVIFVLLIFVIIFSSLFKSGTKTNKSLDKQSKLNKSDVGVYKNRGVKSFEIRGAKYRNLRLSDTGHFIGFVQIEENPHDKYAVAVYKNTATKLGYTPKENIRLHRSLKELYNGKVIAWGYLDYIERDNQWKGIVSIPIGVNDKEIEIVTQIINKQEEIKGKVKSNNLSINEIFEILELAYELNEKCKQILSYHKFNVEVPKTLIPSLSKELENKKDFPNLIRLEKYLFLINELSEKYKLTTLNRIEQAKTDKL
jgi:hypothetical protein